MEHLRPRSRIDKNTQYEQHDGQSDLVAEGLQMMVEWTMAGTRMSDGKDKAFAKAGVGKGELWQGIKLK
jgi:hypothetical protein